MAGTKSKASEPAPDPTPDSPFGSAPEGYHEDYLVVTDVPQGRDTTDGSYEDAVALGVDLTEEHNGTHFCIRKRYVKDD